MNCCTEVSYVGWREAVDDDDDDDEQQKASSTCI